VKFADRVRDWLTPQRRKWLSRLWIAGTIAYDSLRAYVISRALSHNGVNGLYYFIFAIAVAIPYSWTSLRLILAIVDEQKTKIYTYFLATAILFFMPDIYVFIVARHVDRKIYVIYGAFLAFTTTITAVGLWKDAKRRKRSHSEAEDRRI
jgi:hypothetical protein